jgi:hypothetical protein
MVLEGEDVRLKKTEHGNLKRKYAKPISLYPLKPEEALWAFMKVNPKKIKARAKKNEREKVKENTTKTDRRS